MKWKLSVTPDGRIVALTREGATSATVASSEEDSDTGVIIDRDSDGKVCGLGVASDEPLA